MKLAVYFISLLVLCGIILLAGQRLMPRPVAVVNQAPAPLVPVQPQGPLSVATKNYKITSNDQLKPAFVDIAHQILTVIVHRQFNF